MPVEQSSGIFFMTIINDIISTMAGTIMTDTTSTDKRNSLIKFNISYSTVQGFYWTFYSVAAIYVSVYMLSKGYSNTAVGLVIAVGNIASVLCQSVLSNIADRNPKVSNLLLLKLLTVLLFAFTAAVFLIGRNCFALTFCYTFVIIIFTTMQPFANALGFDMSQAGSVHVSFGVARAMGSLLAGIQCYVVGVLVTSFGEDSIIWEGLLIVVVIFISFLVSGRLMKTGSSDLAKTTQEKTISLGEFIKGHKAFIILSLGVVLLFFGNAVLENFIYQIVVSIGGDASQMGAVAAVGAIMEVPAMVCFDKIIRHFSYRTLLVVASVFFLIKMVMFLLAGNLIVIYLAYLNQILGYGLIFPAMVGFIDNIMHHREAVRGQAVFTMAMTIGQVLGMVIGGRILDLWSVHALLLLSTILTTVAVAIFMLIIKKVK